MLAGPAAWTGRANAGISSSRSASGNTVSTSSRTAALTAPKVPSDSKALKHVRSRSGLNLADTLTGYAELLADFIERLRLVGEESPRQDLLSAVIQHADRTLQQFGYVNFRLFLERARRRRMISSSRCCALTTSGGLHSRTGRPGAVVLASRAPHTSSPPSGGLR